METEWTGIFKDIGRCGIHVVLPDGQNQDIEEIYTKDGIIFKGFYMQIKISFESDKGFLQLKLTGLNVLGTDGN